MKFKSFIAAFSFGLMILSLSTSCEKKTDCKIIIKTQREDGSIVPAANVKLYATVKAPSGASVESDLRAEGNSDGSGSVSFIFKLPAILDIKATSDTLEGTGIIKLEEGKTVDKTVILK